MSVSEPLLLIAFNRPDLFECLIERLRETKPQKIYVAVDGPRPGNHLDAVKVAETLELIATIDWTQYVQVLAQDSNLGCGRGVSTALSWFFDQEERGIILEDDILPQPTFFGYCTELLDRYANDDRVLAVSGCNFVPQGFQSHPELPYRFSRVPHIWGWATWRRSWELHSLNMSNWRERMGLKQLWAVSGRSLQGVLFWRSIFDLLARGQIDTWDMQYTFEGMAREMWTATSNVNLVDNIGFGAEATHTEIRPTYLRTSENIELPLPEVAVEVDEMADAWSRTHVFQATAGGMVGQGFRYLKRKLLPTPT